jgi:hypothetical protein
MTFAYGTITLCGRTFQTVQLAMNFLTPWERNGFPQRLPQPRQRNARSLDTLTV